MSGTATTPQEPRGPQGAPSPAENPNICGRSARQATQNGGAEYQSAACEHCARTAPTCALRLDGKVVREADGFFEAALGLYGEQAVAQVTLKGFDVVAEGYPGKDGGRVCEAGQGLESPCGAP